MWKLRGVRNAGCGKCGLWKIFSVENAVRKKTKVLETSQYLSPGVDRKNLGGGEGSLEIGLPKLGLLT